MKNTVFCSHFPPIFLVSQACAFSSVRQFLWYLPSYLHITWIYYSFFSLVIICSFFRLWRSWKSRISHFFPPLLTSLLCTTFSNPYSLSLTDYDYTIIVLDESSVFYIQFSSVSQLCPTLQPHELQHTRPPCPSPTPRVHPNLCPLSRWCHPTISSSVVPFSSCPQSFPASGSFQMSQLFALGGQNIGVSASTSVLPMNTQDWSPLGWTGWISLQSKGLSRVFSNITIQKYQFSALSFLHSPTLTSIYDHWENHSLD